MSITECDLCYIDLLNSKINPEKDFLDIVQNIKFSSVDKQNQINNAEEYLAR
jgi:hypothetical protein